MVVGNIARVFLHESSRRAPLGGARFGVCDSSVQGSASVSPKFLSGGVRVFPTRMTACGGKEILFEGYRRSFTEDE